MKSQSRRPDASDNRPFVLMVMGKTGAGKSNFLNKLAGKDSQAELFHVGHELESCTKEPSCAAIDVQGRQILLVDTPGFDDTYRSDKEILESITNWMEDSYKQGLRVNAVVFLHMISEIPVDGPALQTFHVFMSAIGKACFPNVVMCTTRWEDVAPEVGKSTEAKLGSSEHFWKELIEGGATLRRFDNKPETAKEILRSVLDFPGITLNVQDEIVRQGKKVQNTSAAGVLLGMLRARRLMMELEKMTDDMEEQLRALRKDWKPKPRRWWYHFSFRSWT